jgi:hypothetical protein
MTRRPYPLYYKPKKVGKKVPFGVASYDKAKREYYRTTYGLTFSQRLKNKKPPSKLKPWQTPYNLKFKELKG